MSNKLVIIGGVAGGASAATRARRLSEDAEIILLERGEYVSFANCGLPYYIGGVIEDREDLLVTTPDLLKTRFNIDVRTNCEVIGIDVEKKSITIKDDIRHMTYFESYDKLILSPGGEPIKPPLEGIDLDSIFTLRTIPDADKIKSFIENQKPQSAVVVGGGFIGLEMTENLVARGLTVKIVEMLEQVLPPLDYEMACIVQDHLKEKGVVLHLGDGVSSFRMEDDKTIVTTSEGKDIKCDMVILAIGVRPENTLAKKAGLELGERGGIKVDESLQTSNQDIYAVGDAIEVTDIVSGNPVMIPLAGPANKQGRIAADNVFGRARTYDGTQGTAVVKVFDMTVALTGNNERTLKQNNIPHMTSHTHSDSHADYYPGANRMAVKLVFDPDNGKVLGAQIIGEDGVDKRIDVLATAIHAGMTVFDLEELELAYAPPYSSAKDPVNIAGMVASNQLRGDLEAVNWEYIENMKDDEILLDIRESDEINNTGMIEGAKNIHLSELRSRLDELDPKKCYIVYCRVGRRAYFAHRILVQNGIKSKNLSGGLQTYHQVKK